MTHCCFKKDCSSETQYVCLCLCCETYSCEFHLWAHLSLPYRSHAFDSIFNEPREWTKDSILRFLEIEKLKKEKLKKILKNPYSKCSYEENRLDSDLEQINSLIEKVSQISEQSLLSDQLNMQHDSGIMIPEDSELHNSVQLFCRLNELRLKTSRILNRDKNDEEIEEEFRKTCSFYQNYAFDPLLSQALQEYINAYKKISSLYLIHEFNNEYHLFIYDTESDSEEIKFFAPLDRNHRNYEDNYLIVPLPNGELFYTIYDRKCAYYTIIDRDYKYRWLSCIGNEGYCCSAIYFKKSIYCFGEWDAYEDSIRSSRFDLDKGKWIKLTSLPKKSRIDSSIIFNNNILLSDFNNQTLYLYSVEIDSFSEIILSNFHEIKGILINSNRRAYLIELRVGARIFESGYENVYSWKDIGISTINAKDHPRYFSYNKGEIYIAFANLNYQKSRQYFKFDLSQKSLIEIACYREHSAVRKLNGRLEVLKLDGQTFKLNPDYSADFTNKRYSLYYLSEILENIESLNQEIEINPIKASYYLKKGSYLSSLGRYFDAVEWLNKAIEAEPNYSSYFQKGKAFRKMGLNLEAIQCFDQAISFENNVQAYLQKGSALHDLNRHQEAIECYDKAIIIIYDENKGGRPYKPSYYYREFANYLKGEALYALGQYDEALDWYNKDPPDNKAYFRSCLSKGKALCELDRKLEAIDCYSELLERYPDKFFFYCCRAYVLNDVGREEEAMLDFNRAYYLMPIKRIGFQNNKFDWNYNFIDDDVVEYFLDLMKMICTLEENAVKFKDEIKKLKNSKNVEIIQKVEENEGLFKEMRSKILKKAVECLDSRKDVPIGTIQQVEKEVINHIKHQYYH